MMNDYLKTLLNAMSCGQLVLLKKEPINVLHTGLVEQWQDILQEQCVYQLDCEGYKKYMRQSEQSQGNHVQIQTENKNESKNESNNQWFMQLKQSGLLVPIDKNKSESILEQLQVEKQKQALTRSLSQGYDESQETQSAENIGSVPNEYDENGEMVEEPESSWGFEKVKHYISNWLKQLKNKNQGPQTLALPAIEQVNDKLIKQHGLLSGTQSFIDLDHVQRLTPEMLVLSADGTQLLMVLKMPQKSYWQQVRQWVWHRHLKDKDFQNVLYHKLYFKGETDPQIVQQTAELREYLNQLNLRPWSFINSHPGNPTQILRLETRVILRLTDPMINMKLKGNQQWEHYQKIIPHGQMVLHSFMDEPAQKLYDPKTGCLRINEWLNYGIKERLGKDEAYQEFDKNGTCTTKIWRLGGFHHRLDGPAFEYVHTDDAFYQGQHDYIWYQNGVITRNDGPAKLFMFANGQIKESTWIKDGQTHRALNWNKQEVEKRIREGTFEIPFAYVLYDINGQLSRTICMEHGVDKTHMYFLFVEAITQMIELEKIVERNQFDEKTGKINQAFRQAL